MGKRPFIGGIGAFCFGLALAGNGCEMCSNNAKRLGHPGTSAWSEGSLGKCKQRAHQVR